MNTARQALGFRLLALAFGLSTFPSVVAQTSPPAQVPAAPSAPAQGQPVLTTEAALQRVFSAKTVDAAWFPPAFRSVLPQVQESVTSFQTQYGALQKVEKAGADYRLTYARGVVTVTADLDREGLLTTLLLKDARATDAAAAPAQADAAILKAVTRLFNGPVQAAWLSDAFLAQVSVPTLTQIITQLSGGLGAFQNISFENGYFAVFEQGRIPVTQARLDAQGRFTSLVLGVPERTAHLKSFAEVVAALKALPGQSSLLIEKVTPQARTEVMALNPDAALAIGSTFKLAILAELQAQVAAGKLAWSTEAALTDADKSLPSGTLQNEPSGSTYTLQKLAEAMISVSDNTATDLLLRTVGRSGVEARLGSPDSGEAPMLGTRELFALKNPANAALLDRYLKTTGEARRTVIAEAARAPLPDLTTLSTSPLTLNLAAEWHVSARRLCALMSDVAALPLTSINPGAAVPTDFAKVSYKGGSDGGVLNLTTQVVTKKGETYCVSATWNNTQLLDDFRLIPLVQDALALLK
jgi:beta-lactamase class A